MRDRSSVILSVGIFCTLLGLLLVVLLLVFGDRKHVTVKGEANFTVIQQGYGRIQTDSVIFTSVGDVLVQDKMTEKWIVVRGPSRIVVNDPASLRILQNPPAQVLHNHQKGNKL